jgi:hypothetical protein
MNGDERILVLGGSGLVGYQVARKLAGQPFVREMVIAARRYAQVQRAVADLRAEFPAITVRGYAGDLLLPGEPCEVQAEQAQPVPPGWDEPELRRHILDGLYGDFDAAYQSSTLARLLLHVRPDVVVDSMSTATGLSYRDLFGVVQAVRASLDRGPEACQALREDVERLLVSLPVPQLILHARILERALREAKPRLYLKVGTTGTGGMGLNIPYTHGEARPSPELLSKTAVAFAHTGLLFLMGRTPGEPIIKELKPAALVGYRGVAYREALGPQYVKRERDGRVEFEIGPRPAPFPLYRPKQVPLSGTLDLRPDPSAYEPITAPDGSRVLKVPLVDMGENGLYTRGEFEAITAMNQMESITPEEIADVTALEVRGACTGKDVIAAVSSAVLGPSYRAAMLRPVAIELLRRLEEAHGVPSIALGCLGPPELTKLLVESYLFARRYGTLQAVAALGEGQAAAKRASRELSALLDAEPFLASLITSIGTPILAAAGETLLRGPVIKSPAYRSLCPAAPMTPEDVDRYARCWADLRPPRMAFWLSTFRRMLDDRRARGEAGASTAGVGRQAYLANHIQIGSVAAWILGNEGGGRFAP